MPDVTAVRIMDDLGDHYSGVRVTSAIIHDGPNVHQLRLAYPEGEATLQGMWRDAIAEAFRLGKEAR